jgi:hypothetical protein
LLKLSKVIRSARLLWTTVPAALFAATPETRSAPVPDRYSGSLS